MSEPERSLTHRTLSGLLWTAWGKGAVGVLQMVVLAILARLLAPADFGVVSVAAVVMGLAGIVSDLGITPALVQHKNLERRHLETAFTISVLLDFALGAVVWLLAPVAADFFHNQEIVPVLRVTAWLFPITGVGSVAMALQRRDLRFRWLVSRDLISYAIGSGAVAIGLAFAGLGVWALVIGKIAESLIRTGILLASRPVFPRGLPERRALNELMYYGGGFTVAKLANYLAVQGDNLVVGRTLGPTALGYYGRAYQLMSMPAAGFGAILDSVLFPAMARVQGDARRLAGAYRRGVGLIAVVVLPISAALIILAPELILVVLGPRWTVVVTPFRILAAGMLFRCSYKMSDSLCRATAAVYRRARRQIVYAALVVGGTWIGSRWGIAGAAVAVSVALTVNFVLMAQLSLDIAEMTWASFGRAHVPAILLTGASSPVVWIIATLLRPWGLPPLVTLLGAGGGACLWVLALLRFSSWTFLSADVLWIITALRDFLPGGRRAARRAPTAASPMSTHEPAAAGEAP